MLAIRAERAFDGERLVRGGVVVLLDEGRIVAVGRDATVVPADVHIAGFPDATVLPGLVDAHVHLCGDGRPGALDRLPEYDDDGLAEVIRSSLTGQLAAGVTSVRDLGDRRAAVLDWRRRAITLTGPEAAAPTIVASGPPITSRNGHCANCPVTTKMARLMAMTCDEESSLSIHDGNDARFACFRRCLMVALANEDCSERAFAAGVGRCGCGDGFRVGRGPEQSLRG